MKFWALYRYISVVEKTKTQVTVTFGFPFGFGFYNILYYILYVPTLQSIWSWTGYWKRETASKLKLIPISIKTFLKRNFILSIAPCVTWPRLLEPVNTLPQNAMPLNICYFKCCHFKSESSSLCFKGLPWVDPQTIAHAGWLTSLYENNLSVSVQWPPLIMHHAQGCHAPMFREGIMAVQAHFVP